MMQNDIKRYKNDNLVEYEMFWTTHLSKKIRYADQLNLVIGFGFDRHPNTNTNPKYFQIILNVCECVQYCLMP